MELRPTPLAQRMLEAADLAEDKADEAEARAESARRQAAGYDQLAALLRCEATELRERAALPLECAS